MNTINRTQIILLLIFFASANSYAGIPVCLMNGKEYSRSRIDEKLTGLGVCKEERNGVQVLIEEVQYLKGIRHGTSKKYDYDGKLEHVQNYNNRKLDGLSARYRAGVLE